jgi:VWFA-related protein
VLARRHLLFLPAAAWAQATFSTSVSVVNVLVTVRDREGRLVDNLARSDFQLSEDGRVQEIRYFAARADAPLTLGLLFDLSGSQRTVIEEQRRAARAFLDRLLRPTTDRAFLLGFHQQGELVQALTASRVELDAGLARLEVPRQESGRLAPRAEGTAVLDAIRAAARVLAAEAGRKVLVVLSDGIDTASAATADQAVEAAQRADTLLYPIRFYDREVFAFQVDSPATAHLRSGRRLLERLARETGGEMLEAAEAGGLEANFRRIEEELRNQYSLGFTPRSGRPGYRKLRVSLRTRGLSVRARDGYYAIQ